MRGIGAQLADRRHVVTPQDIGTSLWGMATMGFLQFLQYSYNCPTELIHFCSYSLQASYNDPTNVLQKAEAHKNSKVAACLKRAQSRRQNTRVGCSLSSVSFTNNNCPAFIFFVSARQP